MNEAQWCDAGMYSGMTIIMYINYAHVAQQWVLLLLAKEAENTNSHNSLPIPADECGTESGEIGELLRGGGSHGNT